MAAHDKNPIPHLVADSAAFLNRARLEVPLPSDLGQQARAALEKKVKTKDSSSTQPDSSTDSEEDESGESDASTDSDCDEPDLSHPNEDPLQGLPADDQWITEHNFEQKAMEHFGLGDPASKDEYVVPGTEAGPVVACLTTDFAMQNLLFHLGLHFIGLNGLVIKRPRTRLLWCGSCFRPTKRADTHFCPSCAQASLHRIPISMTEDGEVQFHFSRRYVKSLRGTKQPIKPPRGGKHADEPIYCPDQRLPDRRPAKLKHPNVQPIATNGMLDELLSSEMEDVLGGGFGDACNAFPLHDVCSRSARVGIRSDHQIANRSWFRTLAEHGLKPTRGKAHLSTVRTGNKKKKSRRKV